MDPAGDDARTSELETLEAIYPELRRISGDGFTFELELPVEPVAPVKVFFPAASSLASTEKPEDPLSTTPACPAAEAPAANEESLQITHLPPLLLLIALPDGYPEKIPPQVKISTTPQWLSAETITQLEDEGPLLWEEMGRDLVSYAYIDHIQRAAEDVFGTATAEGTLQIDQEHKLAVLDYDIGAKRAAFEKETFDCGVCLDPKKGSKCHKMLDCGHIFCLQCLQDFYNDAISEGNLSTVRCLSPNCAKERAAALKASAGDASGRGKKPGVFVSPSELLQIGLLEETVKRYVTLKYKTELEADKNTIYCPRQWCNGAARSKKHKKPSGLDFAESFDANSEQEDDGDGAEANGKNGQRSKKPDKFNPADLLAVCEDCGLAFCSRCYQSWHGEFVRCAPKRDQGELTEEEKASLEYVKLHTSPCPTCGAPAQKTHGCNHMICSRCDSHFCYLCSSWLDPANPYQHYNQQQNGKVTSCYMRLWELEGGDGDDVGLGFIGGRRAAAGQHQAQQPDIDDEWRLIEVDEEDEQDSGSELGADDDQEQHLDQQAGPIAVALEAPLVLRLMDNNPGRGGRRAVGGDGGLQQPLLAAQPRAAHQAARVQNRPGQAENARGNPRPGRARGRGGARGRDVRGRGGRGGGGGGGGARGGAPAAVPARQNQPRQQQQQQQQEQQQQQNQPQPQPQPLVAVDNEQDAAPADVLDAAQEAWVRHFVQLALMDAEDEIEGDSDDDGEGWIIR